MKKTAMTVLTLSFLMAADVATAYPRNGGRYRREPSPRYHETDTLVASTLFAYSLTLSDMSSSANGCNDGYCRQLDAGVVADASLFVASGGSAEPGAILREIMTLTRAHVGGNVSDIAIAEALLIAASR